MNEQEADNLPPGWAYVLPTEAQWEYACRAGTTTAYSWGDDINASLANYGSNVGQTANFGFYGANPWGFFDMHGNVWEWTADRYGVYEAGPLTDPTGAASGSFRVYRGGAWNYGGTILRSAKRGRLPPQKVSRLPRLKPRPSLIRQQGPGGSHRGLGGRGEPTHWNNRGRVQRHRPEGGAISYHLVSGIGDGDNALFSSMPTGP